jgi:hypothetical protein
MTLLHKSIVSDRLHCCRTTSRTVFRHHWFAVAPHDEPCDEKNRGSKTHKNIENAGKDAAKGAVVDWGERIEDEIAKFSPRMRLPA